jgi:uncharacterized protein YkwD
VAFTSAVFRLLITLSFVPLAAAQDRADPARVDELVVQQTNDFRRSEGRPPLERDDGLGRIAREFVSFIARTGKYSHEADGSTPSGRARRGGYDFCLISENLAYQYNSTGFTTRELAKKLVEGWKNSAGHRKNMLDRDALHTAVAVGRGEKNGYYYAVQLFARPRSASVDFEVRNATQISRGRPQLHAVARSHPRTQGMRAGSIALRRTRRREFAGDRVHHAQGRQVRGGAGERRRGIHQTRVTVSSRLTPPREKPRRAQRAP